MIIGTPFMKKAINAKSKVVAGIMLTQYMVAIATWGTRLAGLARAHNWNVIFVGDWPMKKIRHYFEIVYAFARLMRAFYKSDYDIVKGEFTISKIAPNDWRISHSCFGFSNKKEGGKNV